jgi:membrane fusion protein (multidrug efflux system)
MEDFKSLSTESAISENGMESRSKRGKGKFRVSKKTLLLIFVLLLVLAGGAGVYFYMDYADQWVSTNNAFVDGKIYTVSSQIPGRIENIHVAEGARIAKGDILVAVDSTLQNLAIRKIEAAIRVNELTIENLEDWPPVEPELRIARARRDELNILLEEARVLYEKRGPLVAIDSRLQNLAIRKIEAAIRVNDRAIEKLEGLLRTTPGLEVPELEIARARRDELNILLEEARVLYEKRVLLAATDSRLQKLAIRKIEAAIRANDLIIKDLEDLYRAAPELEIARARHDELNILLEEARVLYEQTTILSSTDGYIANMLAEEGEYVLPGQPLMSVVNLDDLWITANFLEEQVRYLRVGQKVDIYVDAYPNYPLRGRVESIMPAGGAAFALFPPDATGAAWVRVPQRIPVKIVFEEDQNRVDLRLRIGMLAEVRVER